MENPLLAAFVDSPMFEAVKSYVLDYKSTLLRGVKYKDLSNEQIGEFHRGIEDGAALVDQAFRDMQKFSNTKEQGRQPNPAR